MRDVIIQLSYEIILNSTDYVAADIYLIVLSYFLWNVRAYL